MSEIRRLYRSVDEGRLTGLCAGLGNYLGIDPVVIRLIWVGATLVTGIVPGAVAYLVAWLIVPAEPQARVATAKPVESAPAEG